MSINLAIMVQQSKTCTTKPTQTKNRLPERVRNLSDELSYQELQPGTQRPFIGPIVMCALPILDILLGGDASKGRSER